MHINAKKKVLEENEQIMVSVGNVKIEKQANAKLLGMTFNDKQTWNEHIHGKGGVVSSLNSRLFIIRRLKGHLGKKSLRKVAESLFISKIRYGLQLLGKVRREKSDTLSGDLDAIQKIQNKLVRCLNGTKISDKKSTRSLLQNIDMLSVNQLNASIKLTELWKANKIKDCPLKITRPLSENPMRTHSTRNDNLLEIKGKSDIVWSTFINDGIRLWNTAPLELKNCANIYPAKKLIKSFVKTLPV